MSLHGRIANVEAWSVMTNLNWTVQILILSIKKMAKVLDNGLYLGQPTVKLKDSNFSEDCNVSCGFKHTITYWDVSIKI